MTPEQLINIGSRLFGPKWRTSLAKELGVTLSTVSRWANGKQSMSTAAEKAIRLLGHTKKPGAIMLSNSTKEETCSCQQSKVENCTLIYSASYDLCSLALPKIDLILLAPFVHENTISLTHLHEKLNDLYELLNDTGYLLIQLPSQVDPRLLTTIPDSFQYLNTLWLPFLVQTVNGSEFTKGDIAYVFAKSHITNRKNIKIPVQMPKEFCPYIHSLNQVKTNHQRHVTHVEWLIEKFSLPGSYVLDPFMNTGVSAIAAMKRKRIYFGIEQDRQRWQDTVKNINDFNIRKKNYYQ